MRSQLAMTWGIETFLGPLVDHTDEMVLQVDKALLEIGRCKEGDEVVIVAGSPPGIPGSTNALRIHRMGDAINGAAPAYRSQLENGDPQRRTQLGAVPTWTQPARAIAASLAVLSSAAQPSPPHVRRPGR